MIPLVVSALAAELPLTRGDGDRVIELITTDSREVRPGEILSVMDSGAYFTALESSFGFPRPAIVMVDGDQVRLIRTRETFDDMLARDILSPQEIFS